MERARKEYDSHQYGTLRRVAQARTSRSSPQKDFASGIDNSPLMVAQRKKLQSLFGGAAQLQDEPISKPNNTGLPDNLKSGIESLSGMSMDHVKVHYNSSQPAQLNALAYAQGSDIHVAPGQEKHLPHEAWHVVQQAQGRVLPTTQMKGGVPVNDDKGLEHEADAMGARAARKVCGPRGPSAQGYRTATFDADSMPRNTKHEMCVMQAKTIEQALNDGPKMALAGEKHKEIRREVEEDYWKSKDVSVLYEDDVVPLSDTVEIEPDSLRLRQLFGGEAFIETLDNYLNQQGRSSYWKTTKISKDEYLKWCAAGVGSDRRSMVIREMDREKKNKPRIYDDIHVTEGKLLDEALRNVLKMASEASTAAGNRWKVAFKSGEVSRDQEPVVMEDENVKFEKSVNNFKSIYEECRLTVSPEETTMTKARSEHMYATYIANRGKAERKIIYKVGGEHITDMYEVHEDASQDDLIKTREAYLKETDSCVRSDNSKMGDKNDKQKKVNKNKRKRDSDKLSGAPKKKRKTNHDPV